MFQPKYSISNRLAINIRKIGELIGELNTFRLSKTVLVNLESDARALSSFSSTQIEGNPLPLTDVRKILKSRPQFIRDSEKEVLNYNKALISINKSLSNNATIPISNKFICEIQASVVDGLLSKYHRGKYRNDPVFVNDPVKRKTIYLPPDAADVKPLMNELIEFIKKSAALVDPLIIAGIFHKQFVIIHPFMDGNGRTTRLITKTLLAQLGINTFSLFSFENYYNKNVSKYFQNVGVFGNYYEIKDDIDFTTWLEYFTDGIIDELLRVKTQLPKQQERLSLEQLKILEYIKEHGSISAKEYAQITDRAKATRIKDFKVLVELGRIRAKGQGKSTYYLLREEGEEP